MRTGTALDGRHCWGFRRQSLLSTIRDLDVDLLGLQEVLGFQRRWLLTHLSDYRSFGSGRSRCRSGEASPVLVRTGRLNVVAHRTRWFGASPDRPGTRLPGSKLPRIATTCSIESTGSNGSNGSSQGFDITSLHLDHRSATRRAQSTRQLLDMLDFTRPQIVLGDFNAKADSQALSLLLDNGLRSVLPAAAPGTFHGFSGRAKCDPIDHILVSDEFDVTDSAVVQRDDLDPLPTDHWPVVATLELS